MTATKKPALGRGLSALIPSARPSDSATAEVDLDLLDANPRQPRRRFDEEGLDELARSVKETGILQPVLVSKEGERYRIIAGERRVRAARRAGLTRVPVLVREAMDDSRKLLLALVENVQRRDLTPLEEAGAFQELRELGLTQEEVADRVGKDRATVANTLRLLKLPAKVREAVDDGRLSAGHARALLALPSAADQETLAQEAITRGYTVRRVEERAGELAGEEKKKKRTPREPDADTRDAERRLARALATKVEIRRRKKGGELRIVFYSEEQLIGLFERLVKGVDE
jgi:ParB family transcriptional regulator, chromosome partitioning protein